MTTFVADGISALGDLVLPARCGGCDRPGIAWCPGCAAELAAAPPAARWTPTPAPPGLPEVWSVVPYRGAARACLSHWKDVGRRDLAAVLAPVLTEAIVAALHAWADRAESAATESASEPSDSTVTGVASAGRAEPTDIGVPSAERASRWIVVPAPSGRANARRRGDRPLQALAGQAVRPLPASVRPPVVPALRLARKVADQAGLDSRERAENLRGAMEVLPSRAGQVRGSCCILVDDVITTGATLAEAARALRLAGASAVVAATVAATRRKGRSVV